MENFNDYLKTNIQSEIQNVLNYLLKSRNNDEEYKTLTDSLKVLIGLERRRNGFNEGDYTFFKCVLVDIENEIKSVTKGSIQLLKDGSYRSHRHNVVSLERLVNVHRDVDSMLEFYKREKSIEKSLPQFQKTVTENLSELHSRGKKVSE
jgi:hypothetical protein